MWLKEKVTFTIFLLLIPVLLVTSTSLFSLWPVSEASAAMPAAAMEEKVDVEIVDPSHVLLASPATRPMLDLTTAAASVVLPVEQSSGSSIEFENELLGDPEEYSQEFG